MKDNGFSLSAFFGGLVRTLSLIGLSSLFVISLICTCALGAENAETTYFTKDNAAALLAVAAVVLLLLYGLGKTTLFSRFEKALTEKKALFPALKWGMLGALLLLGLWWVAVTKFFPVADQAKVQNAVAGLFSGDMSMFASGGYIETNQNQMGLVVLSALFYRFFGEACFYHFQYLNAFCLVLIYEELSVLGRHIGLKKSGELAVILLGILFFPPLMYTSFVYGTLPGLAFSLLSFRFADAGLRKKKVGFLALSAVCITVAMLCKSNYLIAFLALILSVIATILHRDISPKKRLYGGVLVLLLVFGFLFQGLVPRMILRKVTGLPLDQGVSSMGYLVLGLSEGERGPGWYTGINDQTYIDVGYDKAAHAEKSTELLKARLAELASDPAYTFDFFARKQASQWANPGFQSHWVIEQLTSTVVLPVAVREFINFRGMTRTQPYLNVLQSLMYLGALLGIVSMRKKDGETREEGFAGLVLMTFFLGGFTFHLFWEAKAQYTFPYLLALFPFLVRGFSRVPRASKRFLTTCLLPAAVCLTFAVLFVIGGQTKSLTATDEAYRAMVSEKAIRNSLPAGTYRFLTGENNEYILYSYDAAALGTETAGGENEAVTRVKVENGTYTYLYFNVNEIGKKQVWRAVPVNDTQVAILLIDNPNQALGWNADGSLKVSWYFGDPDQLWTAQKIR